MHFVYVMWQCLTGHKYKGEPHIVKGKLYGVYRLNITFYMYILNLEIFLASPLGTKLKKILFYNFWSKISL